MLASTLSHDTLTLNYNYNVYNAIFCCRLVTTHQPGFRRLRAHLHTCGEERLFLTCFLLRHLRTDNAWRGECLDFFDSVGSSVECRCVWRGEFWDFFDFAGPSVPRHLHSTREALRFLEGARAQSFQIQSERVVLKTHWNCFSTLSSSVWYSEIWSQFLLLPCTASRQEHHNSSLPLILCRHSQKHSSLEFHMSLR